MKPVNQIKVLRIIRYEYPKGKEIVQNMKFDINNLSYISKLHIINLTQRMLKFG